MKQTKSVLNPAKPTLKMAKEYKELESEIVYLEARKKALREVFLSHGPCIGRSFEVVIQKYSQDRMTGVQEVSNYFDMSVKKLKSLGLVNQIEIRQVSVTVRRRPK